MDQKNIKYLFVGMISALVGGIFALVVTRAIPRMMANMMPMMMENMMGGCDPAEM